MNETEAFENKIKTPTSRNKSNMFMSAGISKNNNDFSYISGDYRGQRAIISPDVRIDETIGDM